MSTEVSFSGAPSQPVKHSLPRLHREARTIRPKQAPLFSYVGAAGPSTQIKNGYEQLREPGLFKRSLTRGAYDKTVMGRSMPGSLRLGISGDAYPGFEQMRNYEPRPTLKDDLVGKVMRPGGAQSLTADSVNGYSLYWKPESHKRSPLIVKELDPQVQLANLARNPLAGALPLIQYTDAVFQTGCDTISCPSKLRFQC